MLHFKYSYDSDYTRCKFTTTNKRHVEMNRTANRQMYKSPKGISSAKKKDLLMLCKNRLFPKQHHDFFNSPTVTTSGGNKHVMMSINMILTVNLTVTKMNLLIHIKIDQNLH